MKRENMGSEFDSLYQLLIDKNKEFILWGAANIGKEIYKEYSKKINIVKIVDKNPNKCDEKIGNCIVESSEELEIDKNRIIIISTSAYEEVSKELKAKGYKRNVDYIDYFLFTKVYELYSNNFLISGRLDISITEKCTLKCAKCNMFMPYFKKPENYKLDCIKKDLDSYFQIVDYVRDLNLLGGEPFLYPEFIQLIEYIGDKYINRIKRIEIFTNATIIPSKELLAVMKKFDIIVQISDYTNRLNYSTRLQEIIHLLEQYNIKYYILRSEVWGDFGFPENPNTLKNEEELISFFNRCKAPFRGLYNEKVYFCHLETSAIRAGLFEDDENDYFDLRKISSNVKKLFMEFDEGYSDKGYITFCTKCRGCGCVNNMTVKSALQMK